MRFFGIAVFLAPWLSFFAGTSAYSADIKVYPDPEGKVTVIGIEGELVAGDERRFAEIAIQHQNAIVGLDSPGGSALAGIEIGKAIRLRGYWTLVPGGSLCASACGYAWLGGVERYMESTSKIGFHAAYINEGSESRESGSANALVGAYLNSLGLSESAVFYVTSAAPNSMNWMSYEDAAKAGIAVHLWDAPKQVANAGGTSAVQQDPKALLSLPGADIFGHDLPGMPLKNVDRSECESACIADSRCQAFTFNRRHSACFLKSTGERVYRNLNADAGYKSSLEAELRVSKITIFEGTDLSGGDYLQLTDVGLGACSDACEADSRCRAFTYHGRSKTCWLKSELPQPAPSKRFLSGVKQ